MTSTSINDLIPSELLFRTFQFFDEYEFVKLREICKSWLEIIDENRSLWQVVNLAREEITQYDEENDIHNVTGEGKNPEWNEKVLKLFDDKSRSTLKEVSLKFEMYELDVDKGGYQNRANDWCFREFVQVLSKSRSTLRILSIEMSNVPDALLKDLLIGFDYRTMPLVDLRLWQGQYSVSSCQVKILRKSEEVGKQVTKEGIALQVLWTCCLPNLLFEPDFIPRSLVSLRIERGCHAQKLHPLLKASRKQLRHLYLFIIAENWELETLHFPRLEVLELSLNLENPEFPNWISCPSSLKLSTWDVFHGLPSISELLIQKLKDCTPLSGRCPLLHTFRYKPFDSSIEFPRLSNLVKLLLERRAQVEAGMEVDGIKMQNIKAVILPFKDFEGESETSASRVLDQVKSLVETVIDSGYDVEKWEVFI